MKIIQLCAIDQTMKVFLAPLIRGLMKQDLEVLCVCTEGPYTEELKREGIRMSSVTIERKINSLANIKAIFSLYRLFKEERPDVVHVHTPVAAIFGRLAARLARVPIVVYTAHGFYFHENMPRLKYKLFLNIEKVMARYFSDFVFTQSQEDLETAVKNGFLHESKILCIGNGIDLHDKFNPRKAEPDAIEALYAELGLEKQHTIITFIGRLVKEKGIVELLEAFSAIEDENIRLLVVGDVDQGCRDQQTKQQMTEKYKDCKKVIFTGFRGDINHLLYMTDIFCLPSYREGMPRTVIEAMAMECAVIATDIRGCREEVKESWNGFLVKPRSVKDIQEKMEELLNNHQLLAQMKANGRLRAEQLYDEEKVISKQIAVITGLYEDCCRQTGEMNTRYGE